MNSTELTRYFQCKFNKDTKEWRTTLFDKETFKSRPIAIMVCVSKGGTVLNAVTYAFYESEDHRSCWFIDIMTEKKYIVKKAESWSLRAA